MSAAYDDADHDIALLVVHDDGTVPQGKVEPWLQECLDGWPEFDALRVRLIVAELLDNAQHHGWPSYVVELVLDRRTGGLTVRLCNRALRKSVDWVPAAGLTIIEALSEQWGVASLTHSTTVWVKICFGE